MSFEKSSRIRGRHERVAKARFVEVEMPMPEAIACPLVIELDGGGRILLNEPAHVVLAAQIRI